MKSKLGRQSIEKDAAMMAVLQQQAATIGSPGDHGALAGLGDDDHAQYLRADGGRTLTGNLVANPGVTIDGVDLSAHAADASAHHAAATAGTGITITGQQVAVDSTVVRTTRLLTSGAGLTGGGDLSADRTLAVGAGNGITVNADDVALTMPGSLTATTTNAATGNHTHAIDSTIARSAITITSGAGLTGGGNLTSDRTLAVGAGNGITVNADDVALTTPGSVSVSSVNAAAGSHTHAVVTNANPGAAAAILATTAAGLLTLETLSVTGNISAGAVASNWTPSLTDTYDLGSSTKLWRKGWLSELESVLFVENTISVIGGWFMIPHGQGTLAADVSAAATAVNFGQSMVVDDFVIMRGNLQVEYLKIVSLASGTTYNVTRNVDGSGANTWPAGQVFIILGNAGDGRIELDAQNAGPRISILSQGATYNAQTEVSRFGDLNGNWGYVAETYGIALGEYASNKPNLVWDPTNGLRIRTHAADLLTFDVSGNADISGVLRLGANGGIYQGTGTFASPTTGLKLWNDGGVGRLSGYKDSIFQAGINSNGQIEAASGSLVIDQSGMILDSAGLAVSFRNAGTMFARMGLRNDHTLSIMGVHGSPTNLEDDPSFETGAAWADGMYMVNEISTSYHRTGAKSMRVTWTVPSLEADNIISPSYAIPGEAVLVRFFVKYPSGANSLGYHIRWNGDGIFGGSFPAPSTLTTAWQEMFAVFEKPAGKTSVVIVLDTGSYGFGGGSGEIVVDDVEVYSLTDKDVAEIAINRDGTSLTGYAAFKKGPNVTLANGDNHNVAISADTNIAVTGPTAAFAVTGIAGGVDGRYLILRSNTQTMTIKNQNASSTTANRIDTKTGGDVAVGANAIAVLIYDSSVSRWQLVSMRGASGAI